MASIAQVRQSAPLHLPKEEVHSEKTSQAAQKTFSQKLKEKAIWVWQATKEGTRKAWDRITFLVLRILDFIHPQLALRVEGIWLRCVSLWENFRNQWREKELKEENQSLKKKTQTLQGKIQELTREMKEVKRECNHLQHEAIDKQFLLLEKARWIEERQCLHLELQEARRDQNYHCWQKGVTLEQLKTVVQQKDAIAEQRDALQSQLAAVCRELQVFKSPTHKDSSEKDFPEIRSLLSEESNQQLTQWLRVFATPNTGLKKMEVRHGFSQR